MLKGALTKAGEPLNTEEIRVKVREGARSAFVSYRNRVTEVNVPPPDEFPRWEDAGGLPS